MAGNLFEDLPKETPNRVKTFSCKKCAASVAIRAMGQSVSAVCDSCGTIFDVTDDNFRIISTTTEKITVEPLIPLGQRGKLRGSEWEMIGFMQRYDLASAFSWNEYLLFNPYKGFRWLTHNNGHWNYVTMLKEKPTIRGTALFSSSGGGIAKHMGTSYKLYYRGQSAVSFVMGEFYWRVKVEDTVEMEDYISPPEMLSCERNESEVTWSLGEYAEPEEIKEAFKIKQSMPPRIGVAPNQPSNYGKNSGLITGLWLLFSGIIVVVQVCSILFSPNQVVYEHQFQYDRTKKDQLFVSEPFKLEHGTTNVDLSLKAPVDNNWFSVDGELIDDTTGESYSYGQMVEFYRGVDSDGAWSEGGDTQHLLLSSVPSGTYHLNLEPSGPVNANPSDVIDISVKVTRGVVNWVNFLWALFLVLIYPIFYWLRTHNYEVQRWADSDYSPYRSSEDDE